MRRKWSNESAPWFRTSCRYSKFDVTCNDLGSFPCWEKVMVPERKGCGKKSPTNATREMTWINTACFPARYHHTCTIGSKYLQTSHNCSVVFSSFSALCEQDQGRSGRSLPPQTHRSVIQVQRFTATDWVLHKQGACSNPVLPTWLHCRRVCYVSWIHPYWDPVPMWCTDVLWGISNKLIPST